MVDLVLLQSVSYIAGALGVCVAATYYIVNLRNADKTRRREIIFRKLPTQDSYYYDALYTSAMMTDFKTPEEFIKKYSYLVNKDAFSKLMYILNNYNLVGLLLMEKLADADELFMIYPPNMFMTLYERFRFFIHINRVNEAGEVVVPDFFKPLEFLFEEAKRRYPRVEVDGTLEEQLEWLRVLRGHQESK